MASSASTSKPLPRTPTPGDESPNVPAHSPDPAASLDDLANDASALAAQYQTAASEYVNSMQTIMSTLASVLQLYDPSGVLASTWRATTLAQPAEAPPPPPQPEEQTQSLFSSSGDAKSNAPPGLGDYENRELSDADIFALTANLKDEEASKRPLISPVVPLSVLRSEYAASGFIAKIDWLSANGWTGLRRSRGDGDCFYRSMAFAYVERIMNAPDQAYAAATSLSTIESWLENLKAVGFEPIVFEDFYEVLRDLILNIVQPDLNGHLMTPLSMLERFQDPYVSNSVVVFFRLLASAYIRLHEDDFIPFLFDPETFEPVEIRRFCEAQVEATGKEADHPQVQALTRALKVAVDVAYVDGGNQQSSSGSGADNGKVDFVRFESEAADGDGANPITLLYRPGHYDILERKNSVPTERFANPIVAFE